jgi:hypothetical protein
VPGERLGAKADGAPAWIGEVTAVAAHELGNSATALTFALELLHERVADATQSRDVEEMRVLVAQASSLVRLLARLASTGTPTVALDLRAVLAEAEPLLHRLAHRRLRLAVPDAEVPIVGSRTLLERALVELVLALRGPREGDVALTLSLGASPAIAIGIEASGDDAPDAPDPAVLPYAAALAASQGGSLRTGRADDGVVRILLRMPAQLG